MATPKYRTSVSSFSPGVRTAGRQHEVLPLQHNSMVPFLPHAPLLMAGDTPNNGRTSIGMYLSHPRTNCRPSTPSSVVPQTRGFVLPFVCKKQTSVAWSVSPFPLKLITFQLSSGHPRPPVAVWLSPNLPSHLQPSAVFSQHPLPLWLYVLNPPFSPIGYYFEPLIILRPSSLVFQADGPNFTEHFSFRFLPAGESTPFFHPPTRMTIP